MRKAMRELSNRGLKGTFKTWRQISESNCNKNDILIFLLLLDKLICKQLFDSAAGLCFVEISLCKPPSG